MPLKDLIQTKILPTDITIIKTALAAIETAITNKTVNLTSQERQRYGSIKEQNKLLVNKINDYCLSHPQLNSPQVDWTEFQADLNIRVALNAIISKLATITEQLSDTKILHDNDNYQHALTQYKYISYLSNESVAGTSTIKADLAQFFKRTTKPKWVTTPTI